MKSLTYELPHRLLIVIMQRRRELEREWERVDRLETKIAKLNSQLEAKKIDKEKLIISLMNIRVVDAMAVAIPLLPS